MASTNNLLDSILSGMSTLTPLPRVEGTQPVIVLTYAKDGTRTASLPPGYATYATPGTALRTNAEIQRLHDLSRTKEGYKVVLGHVSQQLMLSLPAIVYGAFSRDANPDEDAMRCVRAVVSNLTRHPGIYLLPDDWIKAGSVLRRVRVVAKMSAAGVSAILGHYQSRCYTNVGLSLHLLQLIHQWLGLHPSTLASTANALLDHIPTSVRSNPVVLGGPTLPKCCIDRSVTY
jgi:hypothetical protein